MEFRPKPEDSAIFFRLSSCAFLGFVMLTVWTRKDVKPEVVVNSVRAFFAERSFREVPASKSKKGKCTMFFETHQKGKYRSVRVDVVKRSDGFGIDFLPESADVSAKMGTLSTLFGGGILMRKKLEQRDPGFYERLESDLVDYVERRMGKVGI